MARLAEHSISVAKGPGYESSHQQLYRTVSYTYCKEKVKITNERVRQWICELWCNFHGGTGSKQVVLIYLQGYLHKLNNPCIEYFSFDWTIGIGKLCLYFGLPIHSTINYPSNWTGASSDPSPSTWPYLF